MKGTQPLGRGLLEVLVLNSSACTQFRSAAAKRQRLAGAAPRTSAVTSTALLPRIIISIETPRRDLLLLMPNMRNYVILCILHVP